MKKKWMMAFGLGVVLVTGTASALNEPQRVSCRTRCERRYDRLAAEALSQLRQCVRASAGYGGCYEAYQQQVAGLEEERQYCIDNCQAN